MIKLLALDLDGTLSLPKNRLLKETKEGLKDLYTEGIVKITIATGRRYRTTRNLIDNLGFEPWVICNGGALIKTPSRETFFCENFEVSRVAAIARDHELTVFAQRDSEANGGPDFLIDNSSCWNEVTKKHYDDNKSVSEVSDLTSKTEKFLVAGLIGGEKDLDRFAKALNEKFPNQYNAISVPAFEKPNYYCEISPKDVNKWKGIQKLLKHLKIAESEVCCVGDELNDMPMISASQHGFAMGNADERLKAKANFVCGDYDKNGILDVLTYIKSVNKKLD